MLKKNSRATLLVKNQCLLSCRLYLLLQSAQDAEDYFGLSLEQTIDIGTETKLRPPMFYPINLFLFIIIVL